MSRIVAIRLSLLLVSAFLVSCATVSGDIDKADVLKASAEKYWKLRFAGDFKNLYKLEDRDGLPDFESYCARAGAIKKFNLESFVIDKVDVDGNKGTVSVGISFYMPTVPKPFRQVVYDQWIFRDGEWLHILPAD